MARRKMTPLKALKVLTSPIRLALFDPKVTAPLLIALLYFPDRLRSLLPAKIHQLITSPILLNTLRASLALNAARSINGIASERSQNNWKPTSSFVKSQEIVLITGGASGIGEAMAREFAAKGVKVVVLDLRPPKEPFPSGIYFYEADVTKSAQIANAAADIRKAHGNPSVLINNAGIGAGRTILSEPEEAIRKTFEVNNIAHFLIVKEFLPAMVNADHGHVVTVASMSSFVVPAQMVDYACSKAAAVAFHEGLASELKSRYKAPNVKTTIVHPNWIRTPLTEPLYSNPDFKDRILEPEVVSSAIVKAVFAGRSAQIILPKALSPARGLRGWPMWLQNYVRNKQAHTLDLYTEEELNTRTV